MAIVINGTPVLILKRDDVQSGNKVMTAAWQVVYLDNSSIPYYFAGAYINLSAMLAGDTINIRVSKRSTSGGALVNVSQTAYVGAPPAGSQVIFLGAMPDIYGVEIAMQQTGGVLRTIPCEFFAAKRIGL